MQILIKTGPANYIYTLRPVEKNLESKLIYQYKS